MKRMANRIGIRTAKVEKGKINSIKERQKWTILMKTKQDYN
jgi:hypothetical protein